MYGNFLCVHYIVIFVWEKMYGNFCMAIFCVRVIHSNFCMVKILVIFCVDYIIFFCVCRKTLTFFVW